MVRFNGLYLGKKRKVHISQMMESVKIRPQRPSTTSSSKKVIMKEKRVETLKEGDFVRIKRGSPKYRGDLAKIHKITSHDMSKIIIKFIPRISIANLGDEDGVVDGGRRKTRAQLSLEEEEKKNQQTQKSNRKGRVEKNLFDPVDISVQLPGLQRKQLDGKNCDFYDGVFLAFGFAYKEVNAHTYISFGRSIKPTMEELSFFDTGEKNERLEMHEYDSDEEEEANSFKRDQASKTQLESVVLSSSGDGGNRRSSSNTTLFGGDREEDEFPFDFQIGDVARVNARGGDLQHLIGSIVSIDKERNTIQLKPHIEKIKQTVHLKPFQLFPHVTPGMRVKFMGGEFNGHEGMVVAILNEGEVNKRKNDLRENISKEELTLLDEHKQDLRCDKRIVVIADGTNEEMVDHIKYVHKIGHVGTNSTALLSSLGGYKLYDLVRISDFEAGVVIHLGTQNLKVLTKGGKIEVRTPADLMGKEPSQFSSALDHLHRVVKVGDKVKIMEENADGVDYGIVKHIHQRVLYIHSETLLKNAGMVAVRANSCAYIDPLNHSKSTTSASSSSLGSSSTSQRSSQFSGRLKINKRNNQEEAKIRGLDVTITKGIYKGKLGMVREVNGSKLRVELFALDKVLVLSYCDI